MFLPPDGPPNTEAALLDAAQGLAGRSLAYLAEGLGRPVPADLRRHKGWVGQLIEAALGCVAGSAAGPDFPRLGIELKTIPIDAEGVPRETTFVCTAPLMALGQLSWTESPVRKKLARVLWIPVEADPALPLARRRVGSPCLWSPSPEEDARLQADWDELSGLVADGFVESITAHRGHWLQIRPKAANRRQRTWGADDEGDPIRTLPRGFYLRRDFTSALLARRFIVGR